MLNAPKHDSRELGPALRVTKPDQSCEFPQPLDPHHLQQEQQLYHDKQNFQSDDVISKSKSIAIAAPVANGCRLKHTSSGITKFTSNNNNSHKWGQQACEKELLKICAASAQRMGQYLRLRRELKVKNVQEISTTRHTGPAERLRIRLRLALYKVRTAQQNLPLQRLPEPVVSSHSAQASICLQTPTQAVRAARPSAGGSAGDRDLVLHVLPTPPQSVGQAVVPMRSPHQQCAHPTPEEVSAQAQTQPSPDRAQRDFLVETTTKTHIMMHTPTSLKAARGLLQLSTI